MFCYYYYRKRLDTDWHEYWWDEENKEMGSKGYNEGNKWNEKQKPSLKIRKCKEKEKNMKGKLFHKDSIMYQLMPRQIRALTS